MERRRRAFLPIRIDERLPAPDQALETGLILSSRVVPNWQLGERHSGVASQGGMHTLSPDVRGIPSLNLWR